MSWTVRRINYTGRIKIKRSDIHLSARETDGQLYCTAKVDLSPYHNSLPVDALVFLEAYRQELYMRFPFGTVAMPRPETPELHLSEFRSKEEVLFRVKVTNADGQHKLLAVADRVPLSEPENDSDRESLLPVEPADIGDRVWAIDLQDEPRLQINRSIATDWRRLASSPAFAAMVYPAALDQILVYILHSGHRDFDDQEDWRSKWLRFAVQLLGTSRNLPPEKASPDEIRVWSGEVVDLFCRRFRFADKFANSAFAGDVL